MINSEEMDLELLATGLITRSEFDANQAMRRRLADDAAARALLVRR